MMRTFSVKLRRDTRIEGIDFPAGFQIGAITSEVGTHTLLGLLQFHHAVAEEIVDGLEADEDEEASEPEPAAEAAVQDDAAGDEVTEPAVEDSGESEESEKATDPIDAFISAGLDANTAEALVVANSIGTPEELQELLNDPDFDLVDLDGIGAVRAAKIKEIFAAT